MQARPGHLDLHRAKMHDLPPMGGGPGTPTAHSEYSSCSSPAPTASGKWGEPVEIRVARNGDLGITVSVRDAPAVAVAMRPTDGCATDAPRQGHDDARSPGVKVTHLDSGGKCAAAGMMVGSALVSVCGQKPKSHQHAIELLEAEVRRTLPPDTHAAFTHLVPRPPQHLQQSKSDDMTFFFEVVVREPCTQRAVVQSL